MGPLTCPFCNPPPEEIVLANDLCYARYDRYPASPGHLLLIPFRHVADFFDAELAALLALLRDAKHLLDERFHPDGYNIGTAAGQTVMHLHVHVIPRYAGDVADPPGGVRGGGPGEEGVLEGISPASVHHHIFGSPSHPLSIR